MIEQRSTWRFTGTRVEYTWPHDPAASLLNVKTPFEHLGSHSIGEQGGDLTIDRCRLFQRLSKCSLPCTSDSCTGAGQRTPPLAWFASTWSTVRGPCRHQILDEHVFAECDRNPTSCRGRSTQVTDSNGWSIHSAELLVSESSHTDMRAVGV